jgi:hypothetical protein
MGVVWVVRQLSRSAKERLCNGCPAILQRVLARGKDFGTRSRRTRGHSNSFPTRAARKILELLYFLVLSAKMPASFQGDCLPFLFRNASTFP